MALLMLRQQGFRWNESVLAQMLRLGRGFEITRTQRAEFYCARSQLIII